MSLFYPEIIEPEPVITDDIKKWMLASKLENHLQKTVIDIRKEDGYWSILTADGWMRASDALKVSDHLAFR